MGIGTGCPPTGERREVAAPAGCKAGSAVGSAPWQVSADSSRCRASWSPRELPSLSCEPLRSRISVRELARSVGKENQPPPLAGWRLIFLCADTVQIILITD